MASKKNKNAIAEALSAIPVIILTFIFKMRLKPEYRPDAKDRITSVGEVDITKLPLTKVVSVEVERLEGFQYSAGIQKLLVSDDKDFYEAEELFVSSAKNPDTLVKASFKALTTGAGRLSFMLNNATKLYLSPLEARTNGRIVDRNYAEICGKMHNADVAKAYVSTAGIKSVKADIKDLADANAIIIAEEHESAPIHTLRNSVYALTGMEQKVTQLREYRTEQRKAQKALKASAAKA